MINVLDAVAACFVLVCRQILSPFNDPQTHPQTNKPTDWTDYNTLRRR